MSRTPLRNFGTCITFNGTTGRGVLTSRPMSVTNNFSMSAWINPTIPQNAGAGGSGIIMLCGDDINGYGLAIGDGSGGSGSKLVGIATGIAWIATNAPTLTTATWQHVGMVRRSNTWYLYLNGVEINTTITTNPSTPTIGKGTLGTEDNGVGVYQRFFVGSLDFARMWNVALSAQQMYDNYISDFVAPGCILELRGTTGTDSSGQANTATYTNTGTGTSNTAANILRTVAT
jgi:hypothetical protein